MNWLTAVKRFQMLSRSEQMLSQAGFNSTVDVVKLQKIA